MSRWYETENLSRAPTAHAAAPQATLGTAPRGIPKRANRIQEAPPATPLSEDACDLRTVQELLDHKDLRTIMIYEHVLNRGVTRVQSPADRP